MATITAASRLSGLLGKLSLEAVNPGAASGIDGWISDENGEELVSINPATGQELARVVKATRPTYDLIVDRAVDRFSSWRRVPAPKRGLLVRDLANALREFQEPLGELVTAEMGKIRAEGIGEVQEMVDICDFAVGLSRQLYGLTIQSERPDHRMMEQWHPLGPVGIITAFNFPAAVWAWNSALAAVCGDTMIWKPSHSTPLVAVAIQKICDRVTADHGLDGLFNLIIGSNEDVAQPMTGDSRLPLISFTGSVPVGRHVAKTVAGRLGRSLLELGGNNAIIVSEKADLDLAIPAIVFGAIGTTGQRCTSTRRLIVHSSIVSTLTERLINAYRQIRIGDPLDEETLMGPLVNERATWDMQQALEQAQSEGGEILHGGGPLPEKGSCFVEPAIVRMPAQTPLVCDETFAPILYVMQYKNIDEALTVHNSVPQGLSSAIFTTDLQESELFVSAAGSDCGIANINIGTSGAEIGGAFGGEKETGGGRESGSDAWKIYMRRQTNTVNWSNDLPLAQGIKFG